MTQTERKRKINKRKKERKNITKKKLSIAISILDLFYVPNIYNIRYIYIFTYIINI